MSVRRGIITLASQGRFRKVEQKAPRAQHVEAIVCGLAKEQRDRHRLPMLRVAYIDDSGKVNDPTSKVMVLGGYIAEARQWSDFCDEWASHLKAYKLPYVHMREALRGEGVFDGWKRDETDTFLERCAKIINKNVSFGAAVVVWQDAWTYAVQESVKHGLMNVGVRDYTDPYLFKLQYLKLGLLFHAAKKGYEDEIQIVFDEHDVDARRVGALIMQLGAAAPAYLANRFTHIQQTVPGFRDDTKVTPLQAADMGAWYVRRRFDKGIGGASQRSYEKEILRGPKFVQQRFDLAVMKAKVDGDVAVAQMLSKIPPERHAEVVAQMKAYFDKTYEEDKDHYEHRPEDDS